MNTDPASASEKVLQSLCLGCGLCCDGTLFKDVELQPEDDAQRLKALGILLRAPSQPSDSRKCSEGALVFEKFPQPCSALCSDKTCRIYADRPIRCRQFECALFKSVSSVAVSAEAAFRIIRKARLRAEKVRRLLRKLGDEKETLALSLRFRRLRRRIESQPLTDEIADDYAKLSLAVHELNLQLRADFYPDPAD